MPLHEFWHGDLRLFQAYQKAYYRNVQYTAWWHGNYNHVAFTIGINNAFAKNNEQRTDFVEYKDITQKLYHPEEKVTKENLEQKFRNHMLEQQKWFRSILNK